MNVTEREVRCERKSKRGREVNIGMTMKELTERGENKEGRSY